MLSREDMDLVTPVGDQRDPDYVSSEIDAATGMGFLMAERQEYDYSDTFDAALGRFYDEDLAISTFLAGRGAYGVGAVGKWAGRDRLEFSGNAYNDRNNALREMHENGEILPEIWEAFSGAGGAFQDRRVVNWDAMAKYAQSTGRTDILTDKQVKSQVRDELKSRRSYSDAVDAKGNLAGSLVGQLTAAMSDPPNMLTVVAIPSMAIKGIGFSSNAIRGMAYGAAVDTGVETLIQGQVYRFKQDIDAPYPLRNALYNVLAATGSGVVFGGVAGVGATVGARHATKRAIREKIAQRLSPDVVTTREVSAGIKEIQTRAYHGTTKEFDRLETRGLGAHVAVEPGAAATYGYNNGRVYEIDVEEGNFLRVSDPGDTHRSAEPVIQQLVRDGVLPPSWVEGLEVTLREGLDDVENMKLDWLSGKTTDENVMRARAEGKITDDDLSYIMGDVADMDDLPTKFIENNEKALRAVKRQFKRDGYDGLVYEGAGAEGAGKGEMYVLFDSSKAEIKSELTPDGARALGEAEANAKVYTDELDKSPDIPIKAHEENIRGAADDLNDISPINTPDEGVPLPDAEEIAAIDAVYAETDGVTMVEGYDGVRRTAAQEVEEAEKQIALLDKVIRCMTGG